MGVTRLQRGLMGDEEDLPFGEFRRSNMAGKSPTFIAGKSTSKPYSIRLGCMLISGAS